MPDIRHLNVPIRSKFNLAGMEVYSRENGIFRNYWTDLAGHNIYSGFVRT